VQKKVSECNFGGGQFLKIQWTNLKLLLNIPITTGEPPSKNFVKNLGFPQKNPKPGGRSKNLYNLS
jgi:hypothetical protein